MLQKNGVERALPANKQKESHIFSTSCQQCGIRTPEVTSYHHHTSISPIPAPHRLPAITQHNEGIIKHQNDLQLLCLGVYLWKEELHIQGNLPLQSLPFKHIQKKFSKKAFMLLGCNQAGHLGQPWRSLHLLHGGPSKWLHLPSDRRQVQLQASPG